MTGVFSFFHYYPLLAAAAFFLFCFFFSFLLLITHRPAYCFQHAPRLASLSVGRSVDPPPGTDAGVGKVARLAPWARASGVPTERLGSGAETRTTGLRGKRILPPLPLCNPFIVRFPLRVASQPNPLRTPHFELPPRRRPPCFRHPPHPGRSLAPAVVSMFKGHVVFIPIDSE